MPTLPAIVALLTRIAEAVEAPRDARRRGYGVADVLTMAEAARLCHMRREDFQTWSLAQGLHRRTSAPGLAPGGQGRRRAGDEEGVHIMSDHAGPWRDSNASIWKFNLPVGNAYLIPMPARATLLHVGVQGVTPCLWAAVDTRARKVGRRIQIAGTGHDLPLGKYVGTFQLHGGALVFHVFDCGEEELPEACHD